MIRQAVILCGGLGTRLGGLTARTPKPLLPVAGAPFLDVLVGEAVRQGFDDILLLAGHLAEEIEVIRSRNQGQRNVCAQRSASQSNQTLLERRALWVTRARGSMTNSFC